MSKGDKLNYEKELLGIYLSGHPLDTFKGLIYSLDSFHKESELESIKERKPFELQELLMVSIHYTLEKITKEWRHLA